MAIFLEEHLTFREPFHTLHYLFFTLFKIKVPKEGPNLTWKNHFFSSCEDHFKKYLWR